MTVNKAFAYIKKDDSLDSERSIICYASTNSVDRHGDMILPTAWSEKGMKNYRKNPVILLNHDYHNTLPVGKSLWQKTDDKGLKFKIQFADTDLGRELYYLYSGGYMSSFSVGFRPVKTYDNEDTKKYKDEDGNIPHTVYEECELLELSAVNLPANADANMIRTVKGLVEQEKGGFVKSKELIDFIGGIKSSKEYIELISEDEAKEAPQEKAKIVGHIDLDFDNKYVNEDEMMIIPLKKKYEDCENKCDSCKDCNNEELTGIVEEPVEEKSQDDTDIQEKAEEKAKKPCKKEDGCDGECIGDECDEYDSCDEEMKKQFVEVSINKEVIEEITEEKQIEEVVETEIKSELDEIIEDSIKELEEENIEIKDTSYIQKTIDLFNSLNIKNITPEMKEQIKKQYGEEFDISSVKVEPYGFEYKIFCKFLGCKVKEIFTNDFFIPTVERGNYLSAIKTVLKDATLLDQRAFTQNGCEVPLKYSTIKLNSKRSDEFLITGTQFYKSTDGESFILQFYPVWGGMIADIYCSKDKNKIAKSLFVDSVKWVEKNNFLRGEKFSVSGEFLERKLFEWDDVIYSSDKDKETIKKNVEKLSETSPSRGMMLVGPPGNGKTTLGKVMMNKMDSTFIWASSKDFEWGADYTLGIGFEMARKLAPAVFFIEDIDGWLNAYTVDLLKTEMDGIRDNKGVLTILTSNFPENMPDALIDRPGRFHHIINFSLPNKENRIKLLKFFTENADKESIEKFADMTEGYSGSHLRELVDFAKMISEDEEISIDEALMKSFEQMKEQRQLIHDIKNEPKKKEFIDIETVEVKDSSIDFEIKNTEEETVIKETIDFEIKETKQSVDFNITKEEAQEIIKNSIINVAQEMQSIEDLVDERIKRAKGIIF
ncbi:MAG: AAA family ATPase [Melioribacteraceae bacterium]